MEAAQATSGLAPVRKCVYHSRHPGHCCPATTMQMKTGFRDSLGPHITRWGRAACRPETPAQDYYESEKQNSDVGACTSPGL